MADWRAVKDFPGYLVNEYGAVMNESRNRLLTPRLNYQDFLMIGIVQDKKQYTRSVALLVAKTFLEPPPNSGYNSVIHLNGDRTDCRSMNLAWRPRWFASRYHQMFDEDPVRVSIYVPDLNKAFFSLREFCTTYGLLEKQTYINMINGERCFHYGWKIERHEV